MPLHVNTTEVLRAIGGGSLGVNVNTISPSATPAVYNNVSVLLFIQHNMIINAEAIRKLYAG